MLLLAASSFTSPELLLLPTTSSATTGRRLYAAQLTFHCSPLVLGVHDADDGRERQHGGNAKDLVMHAVASGGEGLARSSTRRRVAGGRVHVACGSKKPEACSNVKPEAKAT